MKSKISKEARYMKKERKEKEKPISKVKSKQEARDIAIDYQAKISSKNISYGELAKHQTYFRRLGRKFKLTEEFRENGII